MNGYVKERIMKKGKDLNGKMKENLKVYDACYRYKDPCTGKWKNTSKGGFRRKKDAQEFLLQVNSQMAENKFVQPKKLTVRDYLTDWINNYVELQLRKTSANGYKRNIEKHIIPYLGNIELQNLTANHIDDFYTYKQKSGRLDGKGGLSQKSLLYIHRVFYEALEHAVRKHIIPRNVVKDITYKFKPKKFRNDIYDSQEIIQLLNSVRDTYMEVAVALGGIYGMRRGEILGLKWSDIDFDNKVISINRQLVPVNNSMEFEDPKSEESIRTLPMTDEIIEILQRRKKQQEEQIQIMQGHYQDKEMIVCNDDGTLIDPRNFSKRFSSILNKHNMKHIRFHDLRHTCATLMLNSDIDLKLISNWLGHSSIGITSDIYVKVVTGSKRQMAEKMSLNIFKKNERDKNENE